MDSNCYLCRNSVLDGMLTVKKRIHEEILDVLVCGSVCGRNSCTSGPSADKLVGVWLEPIPGMDGFQGMALSADGTARSVNMATLEYDRWQLFGRQLVLAGKSIGNGQTLEFADTLDIVRVDADSLILGRGDGRRAYSRAADAFDAEPENETHVVLEVR